MPSDTARIFGGGGSLLLSPGPKFARHGESNGSQRIITKCCG
jgi:hypothetical protein